MGHHISRRASIRFAREMFPTTIYGRHYPSYESLRRRDPIAANDLLDHIQYGEPLTPSEGERFGGYCPRCKGGLQRHHGRFLCPSCGFERERKGITGLTVGKRGSKRKFRTLKGVEIGAKSMYGINFSRYFHANARRGYRGKVGLGNIRMPKINVRLKL